ncbi:MAG: hypothetical protein AAGC55_25015, partial [Myxococcota bacterium]
MNIAVCAAGRDTARAPRVLVVIACLGLAGAVGCSATSSAVVDSGPDSSAAPGPARALFELPRADQPPPSGFYALPFPNDIRVAAETGRIDMSDYIRPNALATLYVDAIADNVRGFSPLAAGHLRFDGAIDPASLPASPLDATAEDAAVYLVNIDPLSPRRDERVPLRFRFSAAEGETIGANWLAVLPYPGFVLAEQTTHALIVTDRLRAGDGTPVTASPDFLAVLAPGAPDDDAAVVRARQIYQPLLSWLDQPGGDERSSVVSAAVFTTQDVTGLIGRVRQVIHDDLPAPTPRQIIRRIDRSDYHWFDGLYDGPNFQQGEPPHVVAEAGGNIAVDEATGRPIIQRMEELRISFTVPRSDMPERGWPVVIFSHGTGGSYHSFERSGVAGRLARQGLAVLSTDQVMHPPRVPPGSSPEVLFFNFLNPLAARDNTLQGAADLFQVVRLVRNFDITERRPGGLRVRFDPDRVYFFGHSQGGLTGPPFLAHEPHVHAAVLS